MRRGYRGSPGPAEDSESSVFTSCDDYTSDFSSRATSPETDIPYHETELERKKRELVDSSVEIFLRELAKWFLLEFGIVSHAGAGRGTKRSRDSFGSESSSSASNGAQKRQLGGSGHVGAGGNGEGDGEGDGAGQKRAKRLDVEGLLLACPFFAHDPAKYGKVRTCCGPGFPSVHRVKYVKTPDPGVYTRGNTETLTDFGREHLWRRHLLKGEYCPRCHEGFDSKDECNTHLRASADLQCPISDDDAPEGIDKETELKIKGRRYRNGMTPAQKWEDIFQIIFPRALIPSACM